MDGLIEQIIAVPVFHECDQKNLSDFFAHAPHRLRHKEKEAYVAFQGDECADILILVEGVIYSTMTNKEGKEVVVETLKGPDVLAPAFVYAEENLFPVNVVTQTQCAFLYIDKKAFLELLHRDKQVMMNFIAIISERCKRLSQRLNDFALHSLKKRVVEYMKVHQKISNVQWLSRVLGVARPSLSRILSELKAEGIIVRTLDGIELRK